MDSRSKKLLGNHFRNKCIKVAEHLGLPKPWFFEDDGDDEFEDDGFLHIIRFGLRASFDVSNCQNDDGQTQNSKTRAVMEALSMKRKIGDKVLVSDWTWEDE